MDFGYLAPHECVRSRTPTAYRELLRNYKNAGGSHYGTTQKGRKYQTHQQCNGSFQQQAEYGILVKDHRGRFSYLPADRQKYISARALGSNYDRDRLLRIFAENARTAEQNNPHWAVDNPMAILFIKSDLRLVIDLQTCVKAQQSRAYAQKVKISNLQQMARTIAYVQEHGYDSYEKLSETAEAIYRVRFGNEVSIQQCVSFHFDLTPPQSKPYSFFS